MASSSMTSDGSSGSFNCYGYGFACRCKLRVKVDISNTIKNPNRRYLRCPKMMGSQCKFFLGLDPDPKVDTVGEWWNMNMWIGECAKLRASIRDLEVKQQELKIVKKKMKKELLFWRILVCILFTVLISFKL